MTSTVESMEARAEAPVRRRGGQPGNQLAVKHGADSQARIRPLARIHRRRVLRQLRLSPKDLDPVGRAYLDQFCRLTAKVDLIDRYVAEHGLLRDDGEPQPALKLYVSLANSARLALARLEAHLEQASRDPSRILVEYLADDGSGNGA